MLFSWYDWLNSNIGLPLDLIVYLRTSPAVAYERLKARGRKEETGVPMEFIEVRIRHNIDLSIKLFSQSLHHSYEDWLIHQKQGPLPAQVLVLDADKGIDHMITTYEQYKVNAWLDDNFLKERFRTRFEG